MNEPTKAAGGAVGENRLAVLAGEINFIKEQARDAIQQMAFRSAVEIGRRLVEAKEQVAHGEWGAWLEENVQYSQDTATRFMNIYRGFAVNGNSAPVRNLTFTQAVALLGIKDAGEREAFMSEKHEVTDRSGETSMKSVEDMSKRELEKAIRELNQTKANLEATKNVLRTTETKLDEKDAEVEAARKERDEANQQSEFMKEHYNKQREESDRLRKAYIDETRKTSELERRMREKGESDDTKASIESLQQMNHSLREKLRQKDEELLNRPERETVVTKEVVPEDYERLKAENASMGKRLAEYEAHTQGLSLQEYAENSDDDDIRQYTKTLDEETAAAKQVRDVLRALECLPSDEAEMRELARCYMDWSVRRDETREDAQNTILRAQRKLDALAEQFGMGPKLKVVK